MIFIAAYKYSHEKVGAIGPCRVTVSSYESFYALHVVNLCRGWSRKMSLAARSFWYLGTLHQTQSQETVGASYRISVFYMSCFDQHGQIVRGLPDTMDLLP